MVMAWPLVSVSSCLALPLASSGPWASFLPVKGLQDCKVRECLLVPSAGPGKQGPGKRQLSPGRGQTGKCGATSRHEVLKPGNLTWPEKVGEKREAGGLGWGQAALSATNSPSSAPRV